MSETTEETMTEIATLVEHESQMLPALAEENLTLINLNSSVKFYC